jgi:hypothetical protein
LSIDVDILAFLATFSIIGLNFIQLSGHTVEQPYNVTGYMHNKIMQRKIMNAFNFQFKHA